MFRNWQLEEMSESRCSAVKPSLIPYLPLLMRRLFEHSDEYGLLDTAPVNHLLDTGVMCTRTSDCHHWYACNDATVQQMIFNGPGAVSSKPYVVMYRKND